MIRYAQIPGLRTCSGASASARERCYNIASAYALLNKAEEAIKWLQVAADDGFPCYPLFESDANLNRLRKDEHFIAFMTKLKQQWEHYQATL